MFIKEIIKEGDSNIDDTLVDIIISDGQYECIAMYDSPQLKLGDTLSKPLYAFLSTDIKTTTKDIGFYKLKNYYAYEIVGKLNREKNIVYVGNILIEIDGYIPADILNEKIEFQCDRLDCIEW